MLFLDVAKRAARNLKQAKGRTILTALAISVGAFTITMAFAAGAGGRSYISDFVNAAGDTQSLTIYPKVADSSASSGPAEYGAEEDTSSLATPSQGRITEADIERITAISGVKEVVPSYYISARYVVGSNDKKLDATIGIKSDNTELDLVAGSLTDNKPATGKVVIPESYLESFGFSDAESAIGKTVTLNIAGGYSLTTYERLEKNIPLTVEAVEKKAAGFGDGTLHISLADGESIYEFQKVEGTDDTFYSATIFTHSEKDVDTVKTEVEALGFSVMSLKDVQAAMFQAINVATWGLAGFGALATVASVFGIINTMYISVLERTRQIGLMKALGMRSRDVGNLFLVEAAWIGFIGGALGAGQAIILGLIANPLMDSALNLGGVNLLVFEPLTVIIVIASLMLVAVASGFFPSRKAVKLDPIEALRTE